MLLCRVEEREAVSKIFFSVPCLFCVSKVVVGTVECGGAHEGMGD